MGRGFTRAKSSRREGTPSYTLDRLTPLGESVKSGYQLIEVARSSLPSTVERVAAVTERRSDEYDRNLDLALAYVEQVRAELGDAPARVLERRYVDGASWVTVATEEGSTVGRVNLLANRALDWLDASLNT